ncbi:MAG TPA: metalloregulator ArsR/SmtB family transcription factor [Polyangiaceae bacterium]|nr:metalloregulator ArsR/SmtB family transcription factor [Polyangiaceae bacterium]
MPAEIIARRLKALADPARLRILELLPDRNVCEDVYNVSELALELHLAQPTVSHHLRVLKTAGLVRSERMCRDVYYYVDKRALDDLAGAVRALKKPPAKR